MADVPGRARPSLRVRLVHHLRTEGNSPTRIPWALGIGVFLGCTPFYGFHWALCILVGGLLGLNRLQLYAAANLANPLVAPLLVFAEVQTGALLRRGVFYPLELRAFRSFDPWMFGADLLAGSLIVGAALGALVGGIAYALLRGSRLPEPEQALVETAAARYLRCGVVAWEFARAKLRIDPVYLELLRRGLLPREGVLLDVGCGQGMLLALIASARDPSPVTGAPGAELAGLKLRGIERERRAARRAVLALGDDAVVTWGDMRDVPLPWCRAITVLDVLHYLGLAEQEALVGALAAKVEPGGVLLVREADAAGGLGFEAVRIGERVRSWLRGDFRPPSTYRSANGWASILSKHGLDVEVEPMGHGTPFENVLLIGRKPPAASARTAS